MVSKRNAGTTPVTHGWVVKKAWKTEHRDPKDHSKRMIREHDKVISKRFYSRDAANIFRSCAENTYKRMPEEISKDGELQVEFFVTEDEGFDDIKAAQ